jgi:hypothetical protein
MLSENQVKELFEKLAQKHPDASERPPVAFTLINGKEISSGADLPPEMIRDFSEHFAVPVDMLRKCSFEEIELLLLETFTAANENDLPSVLHLPFEVEQKINDLCLKNQQVRGIKKS